MVTIVEVKSLSGADEAQQLRLGLGQVLDYRARLRPQRAVLAVEHEPSDPHHWTHISRDVGIELVWPPNLVVRS